MEETQSNAEYSAGGVVYRTAGDKYEIIAVHRAHHTDWSLPKGHIEQGETREAAAMREVKEETGLTAEIKADIGEVVYFYRRPDGSLIRKSVYHYLMESQGGSFPGPNFEVDQVRWVPIEHASELLTYQKDKEIASKAQALLKG
ncbi:MAG: NUDIX hydrolase [Chloroflexota bacterium]|nr:NUDIX hydrolase [Chloroflexota bacterium]